LRGFAHAHTLRDALFPFGNGNRQRCSENQKQMISAFQRRVRWAKLSES